MAYALICCCLESLRAFCPCLAACAAVRLAFFSFTAAFLSAFALAMRTSADSLETVALQDLVGAFFLLADPPTLQLLLLHDPQFAFLQRSLHPLVVLIFSAPFVFCAFPGFSLRHNAVNPTASDAAEMTRLALSRISFLLSILLLSAAVVMITTPSRGRSPIPCSRVPPL